MHVAQIVTLLVVGFGAGLIGAIAGIGGGIIITPVLTIYLGIPIHQAIGTSLIAVITTSAAGSAVHVQRHVADIKLGMVLELATALGAAVAAYMSGYVNRSVLGILFVCFLIYSAYTIGRKAFARSAPGGVSVLNELPKYQVKNWPFGLGASLVAGGMSGLLGIGGGPIKVPVMYLMMGIPLIVATATSNFMIGITAAASAVVYYRRGDVLVDLAMPIIVGVFSGSTLGARMAHRINPKLVMGILVVIMSLLAIQMLMKIAAGYF
jgi:uncharacterized protein